MAEQQVTDPAAPEDKTDDATGGGQVASQNGGGDERKFTQADIERLWKERLDRHTKQAEAKAETVRKEAAEKALREAGDWQKLADERAGEVTRAQARIAELEPIQDQLDRYKAALEGHLAAQRKGLPKHLVDLLDKQDPVDQLSWLAKHGDEIAPKATAATGTPNRGGARAAPASHTAEPPARARSTI